MIFSTSLFSSGLLWNLAWRLILDNKINRLTDQLTNHIQPTCYFSVPASAPPWLLLLPCPCSRAPAPEPLPLSCSCSAPAPSSTLIFPWSCPAPAQVLPTPVWQPSSSSSAPNDSFRHGESRLLWYIFEFQHAARHNLEQNNSTWNPMIW